MAYRFGKYETALNGEPVISKHPVGLVADFSELSKYIEDYATYAHNTPFLVMEFNLSAEFAVWQAKHAQRMTEARKQGISRMIAATSGSFAQNYVVTGKALTGLLLQVFGDVAYEGNNSTFITVNNRFQETYDDGRLGVCLHCGDDGKPYMDRYPKKLGGVVLYEALSGRRFGF